MISFDEMEEKNYQSEIIRLIIIIYLFLIEVLGRNETLMFSCNLFVYGCIIKLLLFILIQKKQNLFF